VDPTDPGQIDFILDVDLDPVDAVAECTGLNGKVLSVHPNAVSYADDASAHGHVVDPEGRPQR
jgi:hypothetical protein